MATYVDFKVKEAGVTSDASVTLEFEEVLGNKVELFIIDTAGDVCEVEITAYNGNVFNDKVKTDEVSAFRYDGIKKVVITNTEAAEIRYKALYYVG